MPYITDFAELLRLRCGLTLPEPRFTQCLRRLGYADVDAAYEALEPQPLSSPDWQRLLRELSLGETYFFRDTAPLEAALHSVIARRQTEKTLVIWSAGCATGEETYTLAMLCREQIGEAGWRISALGTDINESALATARRGIYGAWSMRGPQSQERGQLTALGERWQVPDSVRRSVLFRALNLADPNAVYPIADLIVCRNVLMYLTPDVQNRVKARLKASLLPGGVLVLDDQQIGIAAAPSPPRGLTLHKPHSPYADGTSAPQESVHTNLETELFEQARRAVERRDWQAAHDLLSRAPTLDLRCAWLRALIYQQQGKSEEAIKAVRCCLYIDRRFTLGYFTLGNLYMARGQKHLARQQWKNAVQLLADHQPNDPLPLGEGITAGEISRAIAATNPESIGSRKQTDV